MKKPICKECEQEGKKYSVYVGMCSTTLIGVDAAHWDENGIYHEPCNPNITTCEFNCSNGHRWSEIVTDIIRTEK